MVLGIPHDAGVDSLDVYQTSLIVAKDSSTALMPPVRAHGVRSFLRTMQDRLLADCRSAPAWAVVYDETPPECSSRVELEQLLASAPTVFTQAMCFGMLSAMMEIASVSGRPYVGSAVMAEGVLHAVRACQDRQLSYVRGSRRDEAWVESFEEGDLLFCTRAELEDLLCTAPNTYFEGLLFGRYTLRESLAALTGRPFC